MTRVYRESAEQEKVVEWFKLQHPKLEKSLVHINNGANVGQKEGVRLKRRGLRPGFPDLFLFITTDSWAGLAIEMKPESGGRLTLAQKDMLSVLKKAGYCAVVAHGFDDARTKICNYLANSCIS